LIRLKKLDFARKSAGRKDTTRQINRPEDDAQKSDRRPAEADRLPVFN